MIRRVLLLAAAAVLALSATPVLAGVVINETQTRTAGTQAPVASKLTVMVQGNKQALVTHGHTIIIDLDTGKLTVVDPVHKRYVEMPFPPSGQLGRLMAANTALNLIKAPGTQRVAGYRCDNYVGAGKTANSAYKVKACFSNRVPGAGEYTAFQKAMFKRLRAAIANLPEGHMPDGVALALDSTRTLTGVNIAGIPAKQKAAIEAMLKARSPMVSNTRVTKIAETNLPASTFAPPSGFTLQAMPAAAASGPAHRAP